MFCNYHDSFSGSFGAFAYNESEKKAIVDEIVDKYYAGETNFNLNIYNDFSDSDLEDIESRVYAKLGL